MVDKQEIQDFVQDLNHSKESEDSEDRTSGVRRCIGNIDTLVDHLESVFKNITGLHIKSILLDCTITVDDEEKALLNYISTDTIDLRCPVVKSRILKVIEDGDIYSDLYEEALSN